MGGSGAVRRVAGLAVVAAVVLGCGAVAAGAADARGAPLRTNACTLLTNADVMAFTTGLAGEFKIVPPFVATPAPAKPHFGDDPQHRHYCSWAFQEEEDSGPRAGAHVEVRIERLAPDEVKAACLLIGAKPRTYDGIGDVAESVFGVGCVRVGDVSVKVSFDGATLNFVDDGGAMEATLRKLALIDEPAGAASGNDPPARVAGGSTAPSSASPTLTAEQARSRAAVASGRRSSVPASLSTPSEAFTNGTRVAQNALLAALLVLLLVFPSELFNATFDKHHERIERAWRARFPSRRARTDRTSTPTARGRTYVSVAAAGAALSLFLNPHLRLNAASTSQFVGVLVTILFGAGVALLAQRQFRRRRGLPADARLRAVPIGLAVALVCVLVSRAVHFQPGYLYGLVGGFAFTVALARRDEGRSELLSFVVRLGVAVVAWIVFVPVSSAANHLHPAFPVLVADSFVAAVFIGGIEGALFALVPIRFLPGHKVAQWSWPAWIVTAAVTAFLFVNVLLRPENGYLGQSSTASAVVTYGLFGCFGVASVAFWWWFRTHPDPAEPPHEREAALSA